MGWWRKWEQSGQQALLLQEKPPVGNSVLIPCGGGNRLREERQEPRSSSSSCWLFLGGFAKPVGDTGTARPPASWERQLAQARGAGSCGQRCGLEHWAAAMSPVPAGARSFTLALAWWVLTATPAHSRCRMGRVAQGQAASSACMSVRLCLPLSHHQVRVKYFPLLQP